ATRVRRGRCARSRSVLGRVQDNAKGLQNAPRLVAVHDHAEPVGSLLTAHALDAIDAGLHVVAVAHRRQGAEQQPENQGGLLVETLDIAPARRAQPETHAMLSEDAQDPGLKTLQPGAAQSADENRLAVLTG